MCKLIYLGDRYQYPIRYYEFVQNRQNNVCDHLTQLNYIIN